MMDRFHTLLSIATCAATSRKIESLERRLVEAGLILPKPQAAERWKSKKTTQIFRLVGRCRVKPVFASVE
jgi:hypothetical protein